MSKIPDQVTISLRVTVAWWLKPYLTALLFFCRLHGIEPDEEKMRRVIAKAITVRKA